MADPTLPPLGLGSVFSRSFALFFRRLLLFVGIGFIPSLVINAAAIGFVGDFGTDAAGDFVEVTYRTVTLAEWFFTLIWIVLGFVLAGVYTLTAYNVHLGKPVDLRASINRTLREIGPIAVLGLLFYILAGLGTVLLIVPGLYITACFFVFTPAILVEGARYRALGRAQELSKGYRWPIVLGVIGIVGLAICIGLVGQLFVGLTLLNVVGTAGYVVVQAVSDTLIYGLSAVFTALLYARLRELKEGVGIDTLVEVFE